MTYAGDGCQVRSGQSIEFRWLGVGGIELRANDQVLVIDPYFTRLSHWQVLFGRMMPDRQRIAENVRDCDFVLVTHAHWDHLMDVPDVVRDTGASALGSAHTCQLLAASGVPPNRLREIAPGDRSTLGDFQVEVLPAEHMKLLGHRMFDGPLPSDLRPPLRARDYRVDRCFSYLVDAGGYRVLDWASESAEAAVPADLLLVKPYNTRRTYEALVRQVRPQAVIPIHWDDFFRPLSKPTHPMLGPPRWAIPPLPRVDLDHFRRTLEQLTPGAVVVIPEMFRAYDVGTLARRCRRS